MLQVMADGSTYEFIANTDSDEKEFEPEERQSIIVYGEHAPRYVINECCEL